MTRTRTRTKSMTPTGIMIRNIQNDMNNGNDANGEHQNDKGNGNDANGDYDRFISY